MVRRILLASAVVALGLALPLSLHAQDMGGASGADEGKKDDAPKPDAPKPADAPKPDAPKPADAPKPDAPKPEAKKTVSFDAPASWTASAGKGGKGGGGGGKGNTGPRRGGMWKVTKVEGDSEDALAFLLQPSKAKDFDAELTGWMKTFETADGKKLDKSAAKTDSVDTAAGKAKTAEFSGTFVGRASKKSKKGDDSGTDKAPEKKAGFKTIAAYLQGPDGVWIARLTGPEKTVEKNRDDFMKWVKSAKVVDGAAAPAGDDKGDKGGDKSEKGAEKDD